MIREKQTAEALVQVALGVNKTLMDSIYTVMAAGTEEEIRAYKKAVGHVIYEVFRHLVEPLVIEHPELKPPGMKLRSET